MINFRIDCAKKMFLEVKSHQKTHLFLRQVSSHLMGRGDRSTFCLFRPAFFLFVTCRDFLNMVRDGKFHDIQILICMIHITKYQTLYSTCDVQSQQSSGPWWGQSSASTENSNPSSNSDVTTANCDVTTFKSDGRAFNSDVTATTRDARASNSDVTASTLYGNLAY